MKKKHTSFQRNKWSIHQCLAVGILMMGFALVTTSVLENSLTMDEPVHALTGYSIIETGDLRLVEDHPPFLEIWMGFPLSLDQRLPQPEDIIGWDLKERRTFGNDGSWMRPPIHKWLFPARISNTFLYVLLCAVVYRWASDIAGPFSGFFCTALIGFDPNVIAHSGLATLDVGVTALSFSAVYLLFRISKKLTFPLVCSGGIIMGLALASKISALPLLPIAGLWMFLSFYFRRKSYKLFLKWGVLYLCITLFVLWSCHLFQVEYITHFPWVVPFPTYWESIQRITQHIVTENRYSFLLGQTYRGGVWFFFPLTFILKTPEIVLMLIIISLFKLSQILRKKEHNFIMIWVYPLVYLSISLSGALNLGYRHLIPIIPYIYLFLTIAVTFIGRKKWYAIVLYVTVLWQMTTAILSWPDYIPYFNMFVGGKPNGYQYLADSNVDWGQGLIAVKKYIETHSLDSPKISAFTPFLDPSYSYGVRADLLPPQRREDVPLVLQQRYNPQPGDYILSASTLRGLQVADPEMYNWFWHREPDTIIAGAMLHYRVTPFLSEPEWVAQCSQPVVPLTYPDIQERFGYQRLRSVTFDCTQSWFFPGGGIRPGWFVLHLDAMSGESIIRGKMLSNASLSFMQRMQRETPTHAVYLTDEIQFKPFNIRDVVASPSDLMPEKTFNDGYNVQLPLNVGDVLTLMSLELIENEEGLVLLSMWQVDSRINMPISLMAHIIDVENRILSNGDSFGIPYNELLPGDVFIQQHVLDTGYLQHDRFWVQTGVYRLDTLDRFPIIVVNEEIGNRFLMTIQ